MATPEMTIGISRPELLSLLKQGEQTVGSQLVGLLELPGELNLGQADYENLIREVALRLSKTTRQFALDNGMLAFVGESLTFGDVEKVLDAVRERLAGVTSNMSSRDEISRNRWYEFRWPESQDSLYEILGVPRDEGTVPSPAVGLNMAEALREAISREAVFDCLRRQAIISYHHSHREVLGHELYCSLGYMRQNYLSKFGLSSAAEIEILMRVLDRKVMDLVEELAPRLLPDVLHLNMQIETVLSGRFTRFVSEIYNNYAENLAVEFALEDVLRDWEKFREAAVKLRQMGVRVGLDRISLMSLEVLSPGNIDVDFAKVIWDSDIIGSRRAGALEQLRDFAEAFSARGKSLILSRTNCQTALRLGRSFGVMSFQGCYIDASIGKFLMTKCTSRQPGCNEKRCAVCQWAPRETERKGCDFHLRSRDILFGK